MKIPPEDLKQFALVRGAVRAEVIDTAILDVKEAARQRCFIPLCHWYGSSVMCPPHNPLTPDRTKELVSEYYVALLLQVEQDPHDFAGPDWAKKHREPGLRHKDLISEVENRAFYGGYPLAMGFAAGECSYCLPKEMCAVLNGERCRHPLRARPSLEACGFDVFSIVHKVGWPIIPIGGTSDPDKTSCASLIGLILLE